MKATKIIYWVSTIGFCCFFTFAATLYFLHAPIMVHKFQELGYPLYILDLIGTAKYIGIVALLVPRMPRLREWGYAGYAIDLVGGLWSHLAVPQAYGTLPLLVDMAVLVVSYISYRRLQAAGYKYFVIRQQAD
jgi:hypothetical protein